jgi:hypothetical protein
MGSTYSEGFSTTDMESSPGAECTRSAMDPLSDKREAYAAFPLDPA